MFERIPVRYILVPATLITIGGAAVLPLMGVPMPGEPEIAAQIEREDSALCGKLGFAAGTRQAGECKAGLADLRVRHEKLISSRAF